MSPDQRLIALREIFAGINALCVAGLTVLQMSETTPAPRRIENAADLKYLGEDDDQEG